MEIGKAHNNRSVSKTQFSWMNKVQPSSAEKSAPEIRIKRQTVGQLLVCDQIF